MLVVKGPYLRLFYKMPGGPLLLPEGLSFGGPPLRLRPFADEVH